MPSSDPDCYSPNNPRQQGTNNFAYLIDRIEVSGARVKAMATNGLVLYPAMAPGNAQPTCTSWDRQLSPPDPNPSNIQSLGACTTAGMTAKPGGLSRPGGFATVRANLPGATGDGSASAELYWPSFGQVTTQVLISAPGVPAATYQRSVVCPAGGCPP